MSSSMARVEIFTTYLQKSRIHNFLKCLNPWKETWRRSKHVYLKEKPSNSKYFNPLTLWSTKFVLWALEQISCHKWQTHWWNNFFQIQIFPKWFRFDKEWMFHDFDQSLILMDYLMLFQNWFQLETLVTVIAMKWKDHFNRQVWSYIWKKIDYNFYSWYIFLRIIYSRIYFWRFS